MKKKILFLIHLPPPIHGVSVFNKNITDSSRINNAIDSSLININYNISLDQVSKFNFKKVLKYLKLWFQLFYKIIKFKPDSIYYSIPPTGNGFYKDLPFVTLIKFCRIQCIYHLHGKGIDKEIKKNKIKLIIHKWVYSNSTVIHLSETLMNKEILPLNLKNSKLKIINNGIKYFIKNSKQINNVKINILFLSNLRESKGLFNALKIFGELKKSHNNIFLNVVGEFRDYKTKILSESIIDDLNIQDCVKFHGAKYKNDKNEIIMKSDILLYPSLDDAFPLVILECMSFGLVIYASDQGGIPDIINSEYGGVFETGDDLKAVDLLNKYLNLSKNEKLKMSLCSKTTFENKYKFERVEKDLLKIFKNN